jgi:UPF0755 protein
MYARMRGMARRVRPGLYEFPEGERWNTIVSALETGRTHDFLFTVPEGLTVVEIADLAAEKLRLARDSIRTAVRDSFLAAARDPALREELLIHLPRGVKEPLEGYLLPETYRVAYDETPRDLVTQMARQFIRLWDTAWDRRAEELGLTRHQAVTLASIVESEARLASERRLIAGVYLNRLRRPGLPRLLEADPTIVYGCTVPLRRSEACLSFAGRIRRIHLRDRDNPYNTYVRSGLPPGPIANAGRAALEAVFRPAQSDYLFFVSRNDGTHEFSTNLADHSAAVDRYQRGIVSTP